jgi:hypothetical protein
MRELVFQRRLEQASRMVAVRGFEPSRNPLPEIKIPFAGSLELGRIV